MPIQYQFRWLISVISVWWQRFNGAFLNSPPLQTENNYREARRFKQEFAPSENTDYEWALKYATYVFEQIHAADVSLDSKAEKLIAVFAGGSGLLSLGAISKLSSVNNYVAWCWAAALLSAVVCVVMAAIVRCPRELLLPPTVKGAIEYAEYFQDKAETRFLGQWHLVCEGLAIRNARKGFGLKLAFIFGILAVVLLAISFWVAFATMSPTLANGKEKIAMPDEQQLEISATPPTAPPVVNPAIRIEPQTVQATEDVRNPAIYVEPQNLNESDRD